ncbi:hypothetical protein C2G38_2171492 [Gigaspora rosea]|uniref:Protein kinase domain-containing protein n=1 Tax=Gigaspora rosea TaxID=44941 RepID=A0A397VNA5_9GLOM|nr:hypothetical protein C2G38_2171492 [Gigaspora rosea]
MLDVVTQKLQRGKIWEVGNESNNRHAIWYPQESPEVLLGQSYTKSSDIYCLGIIMTEISMGRRALMEFHHDPDKRPTTAIIANLVGHWLDEMDQGDNDIKNQILEADEIKPEPVEPNHPIYYYSSKLIITNPIDSKLQDFD